MAQGFFTLGVQGLGESWILLVNRNSFELLKILKTIVTSAELPRTPAEFRVRAPRAGEEGSTTAGANKLVSTGFRVKTPSLGVSDKRPATVGVGSENAGRLLKGRKNMQHSLKKHRKSLGRTGNDTKKEVENWCGVRRRE